MTEAEFWAEFWRLAPTVFFWCSLPYIILNVAGIIWIKMTTEPKKKKKIKNTIDWNKNTSVKSVKDLPVYKSKGKK